MSKHTPGPWNVEAQDWDDWRPLKVFHGNFDTPGCASGTIAQVTYRQTWAKEQRANARLIAAAPDMLEALMVTRQHLRLFCTHDDSIAASVFDLADAAIAKAKGEA